MKKSISIVLCLLVMLGGTVMAVPAPAGDGVVAPTYSLEDAVMLEGTKGEMTTLQVAAVRLESNPTTGFSWQCKVSNPKVLELADSVYEAGDDSEGVAGAGGYQYFVFKPKKAGTVKLTFSYIQAGSKKAEKKQVITVKVIKAYSGTKALTAKTSLRVGETATIDLDANATTGYEWIAELSNANVLAIRENVYKAPDAAAAMPGAGGSHSFSFQALKKGKCVITLKYKRLFEDDAIETLKYTVTVK